MLKKTLLAVAIGIVGLSGMPAFAQTAEATDYVLINDFKYNKVMTNATKPSVFMQFAFGTGAENVGGTEQDVNHYTEGFPPAFRGGDGEKELWVLDANNNALKLFEDGKLKKSIDTKAMGSVYDFAISNDNEHIAFLNRNNGKIHITDINGQETGKVSGFEYATSIEFNHGNELLVVHPMKQGIVKLNLAGAEIANYKADQTTSNFENEKGIWGLDGVQTNNVKLFVRTGKDEKDIKVIAEFPFKDFKGVVYKGANIYGFDEVGNVYFGLVACDDNGVIYRDRIYKCTQNGKVIAEKDVIDQTLLSPSIPRHRIVNKHGRILSCDADLENYYLRDWNF